MEPGTKQGLQQIDLQITSSMTAGTTLQIEIFNWENSHTRVYNGAVNDYHPLAGVGPYSFKESDTATVYQYGFVVGSFDAVDDAGAEPLANSKNTVFFDETGALVYQPGYIGGDPQAGRVTIQSLQTNYRSLFEAMGKDAMTLNMIKFQTQNYATAQLNNQIVFVKNNIVNNAERTPIAPSAFQSPSSFQQNILEVPINKRITPKSGFLYGVQGKQTNTAGDPVNNQFTMSLFFTPLGHLLD